MVRSRFAVLATISFWLYALSDYVRILLEKSIHSRLIVHQAGYSAEDYSIDISGCQRIFLIVGIISLCFFFAEIVIAIRKKRKNVGK
ncbi:MAG: hypothetical protein IJK77_03770 [Lachnospiraceae bacterium]|nr:hypothetical protein [Lachnospiraceae bacterium]